MSVTAAVIQISTLLSLSQGNTVTTSAETRTNSSERISIPMIRP